MEVVTTTDKAIKYKVHYKGWSKGHDEVLNNAKIIKCEEDQILQKIDRSFLDPTKKENPAPDIKVRQLYWCE